MSQRHQRALTLLAASLLGSGGCTTRTVVAIGDAGSWPTVPPPDWSTHPRLVVPDQYQDLESVVDLSLFPPALAGNVPVGINPVELEGPHDQILDPSGKYIYLSLSNVVPMSGGGPHGAHGLGNIPGSVEKLDAATLEDLGSVIVNRSPAELNITADGKTLYVTHFDLLKITQVLAMGGSIQDTDSTLGVIDSASMTLTNQAPTCPASHDIELSADERTGYVTCWGSDQLAIVDLTSPALTATLVPVGPMAQPPPAPYYEPFSDGRDPLDGTIWINCQGSGEVRVFDPSKGAAPGAIDESRTVRVGGIAMNGEFAAGGSHYYVASQNPDRVTLVDSRSGAFLWQMSFTATECLNAHQILVSADERAGYLVCEGDRVASPGAFLLLDLENRRIVARVPLGVFPYTPILLGTPPPLPDGGTPDATTIVDGASRE